MAVKTDREVSKWQKASVQITNLKFDLDKVLEQGFTEEEKKSKKYRQLLETVDVLFDHVFGNHRKQLEENKKRKLENELEAEKKKSKIFGWRSILIAIGGVAVAKILENIVLALIAMI
jgi:hypothetical protein